MSDGWRILDLAEVRGEISAERGMVTIATGQDMTDAVPAADVALILIGPGVTFSSGVLHRLASHGAVVMLCDWRGIPEAMALPWSDHSRIAQRQIAQAGLSLERKDTAWQGLISAKLHGQAAVLSTRRPRFAPYLSELAEQVEPGDPGNLEAIGARHYFIHLWGKAFTRDKDGGDRINALLNYGYGILRGVGVRAVLSAGLVPALGVAHSHRSNPFNLVADLMEPFRPAIDHAVLNLPPYSSLRKADTKKLLVGAVASPLGEGAGTIVDEFALLAQRYGRFAEGNETDFDVTSFVPGQGRS